MMKIFGSACTPQSWLNLMVPAMRSKTITALTPYFKYNFKNEYWDTVSVLGDGLMLFTSAAQVAPLTVPVGDTKCFTSFTLSRWLEYNVVHNAYDQTGPDVRKLFCYYNAAGKPIVSVGFKHNEGDITTADSSTIGTFVMYFYNSDGTVANAVESVSPNPFNTTSNGSHNGASSVGRLKFDFFADINIATKTSSNFVFAYGGSVKISVTGSKLGDVADLNIAKSVIFDGIGDARNTNRDWYVTNLVCCNEFNTTLKCVPFRPSSIKAAGGYSGAVENVSEKLQDQLYVSTSATSEAYVDFNISSTMDISQFSINQIDFFNMFKYVNAGGGNATFSVQLFNTSSVAITPPFNVSVPANQDDTKYCGKLIGTAVSKIDLSNFLPSDLIGGFLRIGLVGV